MADIILAGSTSGSITVSSPAISGTNTLTLPAVTDTLVGLAATQTLTNKTLTAPNLGTPSTLVLTNATGLAAAAMPAGSVLQVVSTTKTDTQASTSAAFIDITGLSASITPSSASNKVLVLWSVNGSQAVAVSAVYLKLLRNSTDIAIGTGSMGSRIPCSSGIASPAASILASPASGNFLDSPASTSSVTYKLQIAATAGSALAYVNRTDGDADNASYGRGASTITVMEIAG